MDKLAPQRRTIATHMERILYEVKRSWSGRIISSNA